ncbi:Hr1 repeat [Popillia japonica]|uniref:Hr1 repeat n=1 Tax=Popillia japonica TaxID=7064 RepID=A0AAW1LD67_POPJA
MRLARLVNICVAGTGWMTMSLCIIIFSHSLLHSPLTSHQLGHDGICQDPRLLNLEKQLNIELKVKQGAENIMQTINGKSHRDKKLMAEAQQMFLDAKAKIEFLKMRILKVKNEINNKHHGSMHDLANGDVSTCELETPLEDRIEDIRHRLKIELAVVDGAKNVIRLMQGCDKVDKKALQETCYDYIVFLFYANNEFSITEVWTKFLRHGVDSNSI